MRYNADMSDKDAPVNKTPLVINFYQRVLIEKSDPIRPMPQPSIEGVFRLANHWSKSAMDFNRLRSMGTE